MEDTTRTILIIDDDEDVSSTLEALLLRYQYHLEFADNGLTGLELAETVNPDLILLDVMMPGMDGFEVCRRLKEDQLTRKIPVIMITALDTKEDMVNGLDAGADDFIHKPFNTIVLRARIRSMLRIKSLVDELENSIKKEYYLSDLGRLAGGIAHDLRNVSFTISGYTELLLNDFADKSQGARSCRKILGAAALMDQIVNGLVTYAGDKNSRKTVQDLKPLIKGSFNIFIRQLKIVEMDVNLEDVSKIECNIGEIHQIFLNLIKNALDAMYKENKRKLSIRLWQEANEVFVSVSDTGPGIPQDVLPHIFKDLFTTKPKGEGTGIGLATVKKIMESHNGKISVSSEKGKGANFTLCFPAWQEDTEKRCKNDK
ncbi:response regulator [Desulfobacterales bacterium HSG17]|nr:response regulator [Desulfobacterales bacterium HSG17]